jgi:hypothetical protein
MMTAKKSATPTQIQKSPSPGRRSTTAQGVGSRDGARELSVELLKSRWLAL